METKYDRDFADINEVLKWLGEENQARADEIAAMQTDSKNPDEWKSRPRMGYKK